MRRAVATALLLLGPGVAAAQTAPAVAITITPELPRRGTVAWLRVAEDSGATGMDSLESIEGEAAGEPLHFEPRRAGGFRALLPIPLEGGDSLVIGLVLRRGDRVDSTSVPCAVARDEYPRERLTVAPRMARPDSAAQVRIETELAEARAISRRSHETPPLWVGPFRLPRQSRITSRYGAAREFNGEVTSRHLGTDFAGRMGAPVTAPARGVVALVADFYLAGHAVYLDHGGGLVTGYFHLSRTAVATGDTVTPGQTIGAVGRSGRVTGPHLHWIARYGAVSVDPMSLVELGW